MVDGLALQLLQALGDVRAGEQPERCAARDTGRDGCVGDGATIDDPGQQRLGFLVDPCH